MRKGILLGRGKTKAAGAAAMAKEAEDLQRWRGTGRLLVQGWVTSCGRQTTPTKPTELQTRAQGRTKRISAGFIQREVKTWRPQEGEGRKKPGLCTTS